MYTIHVVYKDMKENEIIIPGRKSSMLEPPLMGVGTEIFIGADRYVVNSIKFHYMSYSLSTRTEVAKGLDPHDCQLTVSVYLKGKKLKEKK